jgi:hypothetical protein
MGANSNMLERDELALLAEANPVDEDMLPDGRSPEAQLRLASILPRTDRGRRVVWLFPRTRRSLLVAAAVVALAIGAATPAFGLHRVVISWFEAERAPERVQLTFAQLEVGAPPGMASGVLPGESRKVTEVKLAGHTHVLWVAPTRAGGFCELWTNLFGGCVRERTPPTSMELGPDLNTFDLGVTYQAGADGVVTLVGGHLLNPETERLVVQYADGDDVEIPVVWVTPPVDAGFYLIRVPKEHRQPGNRATALVALDGSDVVLARQVFQLPPRSEVRSQQQLPDGMTVSLPGKAIPEDAHKVIDFRAENGSRVTLWVMPARGGGRCFVFDQGSGCLPAAGLDLPMGGGLHAAPSRVLFFAPVRDDVATVLLRYEDGAVERLAPSEGFVLHEIGSAHYRQGKRLTLAVARGPDGETLERHPFNPSVPGTYPCDQPVDRAGMKICP